MRHALAPALLATVFALGLGCASEPLGDREPGGEGSAGAPAGSAGSGGGSNSMCSAALRQAVSLVDEVAATPVEVLESSGAELTLFVDATAPEGPDTSPWVYVSLATGAKLELTDLEALTSRNWDLGFKRASIRTNGGDSGPGQGGAFKVRLPWGSVDASTLGDQAVPTEHWFDDECTLIAEAVTGVVTTFSGWDEYDTVTHVLTPADAVYLTRGADGALYKVAILDFYSNPDGSAGRTAARYKLRVAPLP
ncbi:MAG TPA: HmuY family protein [Polyangiaceae bacterium]